MPPSARTNEVLRLAPSLLIFLRGLRQLKYLLGAKILSHSLQAEREEIRPAVYQSALDRYEQLIGCERPETLSNIGNPGLVLDSEGKYEETEVKHRQALERSEKVLGRELTSISNLSARAEIPFILVPW